MGFQIVLAAAAAAAASPTTSASSTPAQAPATAESLQVRFNRASDLSSTGKCAEAIPLFETLEHDPKVKSGSLPAAAIAVRKGVCLADTGRKDDGERAIALGMPTLAKAGAEFEVDVSEAHRALGDAALIRSDRARAAREYRAALERRTGRNRLVLLARLARATAFDGGEAALAPTQEALALLAASPTSDEKSSAKAAKETRASYLTFQARALLNQGRDAEAYAILKEALTLTGGLTTQTTLAEASLRADLAMAAMLTKRTEDARRYLAYTGAGRIKDASFSSAVAMDPPLCGAETGLRPEDVAVVEFGLKSDGTVMYANTVYSRGGPQVAAAFEQAVRGWYWHPAAVAKIPDFYRIATRIELRCSAQLGSGPGLWGPVNERYEAWAFPLLKSAGLKVDQILVTKDFRRVADDTSGTIDPLTRIAALGMLGRIGSSEGAGDLDKAVVLARSAKAPDEVISWLLLTRATIDGPERRGRFSDYGRKLAAKASMPELASDPVAASTLLLEAANARTSRGDPESNALIERVANDDRLAANHPLRQFAWLALANRAAAAGDLAAAQASFTKTGLTDEQCSMLSLPPAVRRWNTDSGDYPMSAVQMGFEGWVRLEYDIKVDGTTNNVRPIVAYPAMIFVEAGRAIGKEFKYDLSYRPGGANACRANSHMLSFRIE